MIKNIFVFFMTFVIATTSVVAQVPTFTLKARLVVPKREELVTRPKTVEETIKSHFREDSFVMKGEIADHQGYILTIKDRNAIKSILSLVESSCGSLVTASGISCDQELDECQKDCNQRIKVIEDRNAQLLKDKDTLEKKVKIESDKKIIFASVATFVGIGLGALFMSIKHN